MTDDERPGSPAPPLSGRPLAPVTPFKRFAYRDARGLRASINRRERRVTRDEIQEKVFKIIAENLVYDGTLTADRSFVDSLGADSLDFVELTMSVEEHFDVEVPDDVAENWKTPRDAIDWLEKRLSENG